jgi:glycosyltransferase involved in cell wall biosynthesis
VRGEEKIFVTYPPITVAATLPPPVDGMTLATSIILKALEKRSSLRIFDWSPGPGPVTSYWRLRKGIRSLASIVRTAIGSRLGQATLYTVANSRGGLYYNLLLMAAARLRGYRVILHHHVYAYLHRYDWRMQCLDHWLGPNGAHVVLSEKMAADFRLRYGSKRRFFVLPNSVMTLDIEPPAAVAEQRSGPFRLGHCSNLSMDKGLREVIDTTKALLQREQDVQLILAGPFVSPREEKLVREASVELGPRLDYRGPVYHEAKHRFFSDLDVMLFPTRYKNEAQPLVLAEAIAYGKPVIAFDRGCIRAYVGDQGGRVIGEQACFPSECTAIVMQWINHRGDWLAAQEAVRQRAASLRHDASAVLDRFVDFVITDQRDNGRVP